MKLTKKEKKLLIIGLRYAMLYEVEWIACNKHMKDPESIRMVNKSKKIIKQFKLLKMKLFGDLKKVIIKRKKENRCE